MPTVDSKGRVVLPKAVRDRLGIRPGTEVEIREEEGAAVVKPEDDPARIVDRMEALIEEANVQRERDVPEDRLDPVARRHADAIRRGAATSDDPDA